MTKERAHKFASFWAAVILLIACTAPASASEADPPRVLTVAFPESAGISETYEDGTHGGSLYDWLHEISKYTGWEYEFVTGDISEVLDGMALGEYDLMGGMYRLDGLDELFCYPKYAMGSNYSLLMYRRDDTSIKSFDYTTLNGKTIGVFANAAAKIDRLQKYLSFNHISARLVYYDDILDYEACLDNGEVDLLYGSDIYMDENYNVAVKLEADPYYIVTALDEPELCAQLSGAMSAIYTANPNFARELYEKYFPSEYINTIDFTPEELAFVRQSGPIRVAVVEDMYPMFYLEEEAVRGIVPDCLALLSDRTGLEFEFVRGGSYGELTGLLANGEADVIGCYMEEESTADAAGLACTAPLTTMDTMLVRSKFTDLSADALVMALPVGRIFSPVSSGHTIRYYPRYQECLQAINRGEADYTYMPVSSLESMYARDYYPNITLSVDTGQRERLSFAVARPVNVPLYSVLSKAIGSLTDAEVSGVVSQNLLPSPAAPATFRSLLYTNPVMVLSVSVGFVVLAAAVVVLLSLYKMKTRLMRVRLEKAEETSRAKSDFLSRMSHEIRTPMNAIIGLTNLAMMTGEATPAIREDLGKIDTSAKFLLALLNDILDMSKIESQKMELSAAPFRMDGVVGQLRDMFALQAEEKQIELAFDCQVRDKVFVGDFMRLNQVLTNLLSNAFKFTDRNGRIALTVREQALPDGQAGLFFSVRDSGVGIPPEDQERIFLSFEQAADRRPNTPGTGLGLAISQSLVALMGGELRVKSASGEGSEFYFTIRMPIFQGEPEPEGPPPEEKSEALAGLRVLLAEDNDINAEIAIELLAMREVETQRVADGRRAVDLFLSHPAGYYDAILMDLNMPVMDGLQAAAAIRALDRPDAASIPILAMTANTFQKDRERAAEAGMSGFLPKPFDARQLYEALERTARTQ